VQDPRNQRKTDPGLIDETVKDHGHQRRRDRVDQLKEFEKKTLLEGKVNEAQKAYYDAIIKQIRDGAKVDDRQRDHQVRSRLDGRQHEEAG
jgi:hypothetical protein